jgi:hypothetical protein
MLALFACKGGLSIHEKEEFLQFIHDYEKSYA